MVNGINVGLTGFKQNSYGNIQRTGTTENGRAIYRVIDSDGKEAGRLSVAGTDTDKFESAYRDIMDAAPKIQKYVTEHTAPYKYPRIVVFCESLPKTTSGKIQRNKL